MTANYRMGVPTTVCPCGCDQFKAVVMFDAETFDISWWTLQGHCYACGAMVTLPCPADKEDGGVL